MKSLLSFLQYFSPEQARVYDLNAVSDQLGALRVLCEGKPRDVRWREGRAWILGEGVAWADGTLAVTGVIRGAQLSADRLVHLPNFGDFQISKVRPDRHPRARATIMQMLVFPCISARLTDNLCAAASLV